ncbi:unnamed protein product [Calypogeia fissa]
MLDRVSSYRSPNDIDLSRVLDPLRRCGGRLDRYSGYHIFERVQWSGCSPIYCWGLVQSSPVQASPVQSAGTGVRGARRGLLPFIAATFGSQYVWAQMTDDMYTLPPFGPVP